MKLYRKLDIIDVTTKDHRRFWLKVDKTPGLGPNGDCWEWRGCINGKYAKFGFHGAVLAHRFSFLLDRGYLPRRLEICHKCDNTKCIRPIHLYSGTHSKNMRAREKRNRARHPHGETHTSAKLTINKVIRIRELRASGLYSFQKLANMYGVTKRAVISLVHRITWRHVK